MGNTKNMIIKLFKENNIVFYERDIENGCILLLPYVIVKKGLQIDIRIFTYKNSNMCKMGFSCKLNLSKNSDKELLNINAKLLRGTLSVVKNSDEVNFSIDFIADENFSYNKYIDNLHFCFSVFYDLYKKEIIDQDLYINKEEKDEPTKS